MIQPYSLVGWVERKRNPSPADVAMGFAILNPSYGSGALNHVIGSEHYHLVQVQQIRSDQRPHGVADISELRSAGVRAATR
jgi:hypothetical protein